jgi:concanavalin A-like lectin/glucanase superfamily protein
VSPKGAARPVHRPGAQLGGTRQRPSSAPLLQPSPSTGLLFALCVKRYEYSYVKGYGFYLHGTGQLGFQLADGSSWTGYGASTALADGQWHLVAVTVDRDDPYGGTFWADGVAVGTFDPTVRAASLDNTAPFRIGSRSSSVSGVFNGDIDEVEVVGRVLTETEIIQLYQAGNLGRCRPQCMPRPANMTAWYALDEGSGSTANDLASGNTATRINGPGSVTGKVASALRFDGVDDYVEAPSTSFNNVGTGDFSIGAWIRTSSTGILMIADKRREGLSVLGYGFYLYGTGQLSFQLANGSSWSGYSASTASLADGQWHLVAVTVDRDNPSGVTFWVDGVSVGSFSATGMATSSLDNAAPFRIGSRSSSVSGIFNGDIDEVGLFNRVLTAAEISQLYQAGIAGMCR